MEQVVRQGVDYYGSCEMVYVVYDEDWVGVEVVGGYFLQQGKDVCMYRCIVVIGVVCCQGDILQQISRVYVGNCSIGRQKCLVEDVGVCFVQVVMQQIFDLWCGMFCNFMGECGDCGQFVVVDGG